MSRVCQPIVHVGWLSLLLTLCPIATCQEPKRLQYVFKKGDQFAFTVNATVELKNSGAKEISSVRSPSSFDVVWRVQEVNSEGKARIVGMLKRLRMETELNISPDPKLNKVLFDSADDNFKDHPIVKVFGPFQKQGVTWQMDRSGNVTDVKLPDEVLRAIKEDPQAKGMEAEVEAMFVDLFHGWFHPIGLVYPGNGAEKDESWKNPARKMKKEGMVFTQQAEFKRVGTEKRDGRQVERIAVKPIFVFDAGALAKKREVKMTVDEDKGHVLVDAATGMIVEARLSYAMTMQPADDPVAFHMRMLTTMQPTEKKK